MLFPNADLPTASLPVVRRRLGRLGPRYAAETEPDVRIVLGLALVELIAGGAPWAHVLRQVVEHEVAAVGLDGEHRMAFAAEVADDRHQQRLPRKAALDQQLALEQGVDLAVALAVDGIVPMVERRPPMVEIADRFDRAVDLVVDVIEGFPHLPGKAHVHRPELAEGALFAVAIAEVDPSVGNRGFAADRRPGGPGKVLLGRLPECDPREAEDRRRGEEAKEPRKHGLSANLNGDTIAAAAWRRRNKFGRILSIGACRPGKIR